jgi:ArsR family transcriptional regulator
MFKRKLGDRSLEEKIADATPAPPNDLKTLSGIPNATNTSEKLCCPSPPKNEGRNLKVKDQDREFASLAKALGHPARILILRHLSKAQGCICGDLVLEVGLAQATVSQHLKVLRKSGFLQGTISGPSTCYCIRRDTLVRLKTLLENL